MGIGGAQCVGVLWRGVEDMVWEGGGIPCEEGCIVWGEGVWEGGAMCEEGGGIDCGCGCGGGARNDGDAMRGPWLGCAPRKSTKLGGKGMNE